MDIVWIAAIAVMWVAVAEMVVGLGKLDKPKHSGQHSGERS
ncbi:hypothetical protein ACSFA3_19140 [Variovorax sp. RHLX14]